MFNTLSKIINNIFFIHNYVETELRNKNDKNDNKIKIDTTFPSLCCDFIFFYFSKSLNCEEIYLENDT